MRWFRGSRNSSSPDRSPIQECDKSSVRLGTRQDPLCTACAPLVADDPFARLVSARGGPAVGEVFVCAHDDHCAVMVLCISTLTANMPFDWASSY